MVRAGVALYGLDPFGEDPAARDLEPALELHSYVAAVKPIAAGESAGYGRRFVATRGDAHGDAADRVRRRRATRADEQRRGARARRAPAARRHGQHGQRHARRRHAAAAPPSASPRC